jgi:hypothetical protein
MKPTALIFVTCILGVSACSERSEISLQIEAQFKANDTSPINLALTGPASWERLCVLGPYSNNSYAEKVLGFKWDAEAKTSIYGSDVVNVLVYIKENQVVAYTEHPRNKGDFSQMNPPCLSRERAVVVRQMGSDGWVFLVPQQAGITNQSTGPAREAAQSGDFKR